MKIYRAYKTELALNNVQRTLFLQAAGTARWAYNWGLNKKIEAYKLRKSALANGVPKESAPKVPTAFDLHRELNALKRTPVDQGGVPWMYDCSKWAPQEALRNLDKAFDSFFRNCKAKKKGKKGFPRYKSRKNGVGGFRLEASTITATTIRLPRIGFVRLGERGYLPETTRPDIRCLGVSLKERAGRWFVSVLVEQDISDPVPQSHLPVIGVDVGIRTLATCSNGTCFNNPKALIRKAKKLTHLQRSVSRKVKGSKNREKAKAGVARCHLQISNIRKDSLHKASKAITKSASTIVIEDLNVASMTKNHKLARSVNDASFGELHRQIKYKALWAGIPVIIADRWFPSSKRCSSCGFVLKELSLSVREWKCPSCGISHNRDVNAAINLAKLTGSSPVTACGGFSSGPGQKAQAKLKPTKQEPNTFRTCPNG